VLVAAIVEHSMVEIMGDFWKVAVLEDFVYADGLLKSNAFFFSRNSPKFFVKFYLASVLSLRVRYLGETASTKLEVCLTLFEFFRFSMIHSNILSKWFFRFC